MSGLQIPVETKGGEQNLKKLEKGFKEVGTEAVKSEARVKGFKGAVGKMMSPLQKLIKGFGSLKAAILLAMGGLAMGGLVKSFLNAAKVSEGFNTRLKVLLGSTEAGAEMFKRMSDYASAVPFQFEEIMESATALSGVMKGGIDEVDAWMPLIGDLAAAVGMSIQDTTGQVIRMYSAGASAADMFREKGVLSMLGFQAGVSYSAEETKKQLMTAWEEPTSKFKGATESMAQGWSGMMSMVGDKWFEFRNLVMDAGVFEYIKTGLKWVVDGLADMKSRGELKEWATSMANTVIKGINAILKGVAFMGDAFRGLKMIWLGLKEAWTVVELGILKGVQGIATVVAAVTWNDDAAAKIQETADMAGMMADEAEKVLMTTNDQLVALATEETYYEKISKITAEITKNVTAASKVDVKPFVAPVLKAEKTFTKGQKSTQGKFETEYEKLGKSPYQLEMLQLDNATEKYREAGVEKVKLDEWYAAKHEEIMTTESERSLAEFEAEIDAMEEGFTSLSDTLIGLGDTIDETFVDGFSNAFVEFASGAKTAKEAFHDFATETTMWLAKLILKTIMLNAVQSAGGIWGGMAAGVAGAFGGGRADGGPVKAGTEYVVGEKGPETFVPKQNGTIVPNGAAAASQSINIINVTDKSMMDEYMFSESGQKAVMNVMSQNSDKVRRIIS